MNPRDSCVVAFTETCWGDSEGIGDVLPHHVHVRGDVRRLENHGRIDVPHREQVPGKKIGDMPEKYDAGDPLEARVGVGEVRADIAERGGAQECVRHRVQEHVRVGMTLKSFRVRDVHAAEHELPPGGQPVHVVSESYAG
jgi:hypothetical protein